MSSEDVKLDELIRFAEEYKIPFCTELLDFPLIQHSKQLLALHFVKQKVFVPIKEDAESITCAFHNPDYFSLSHEIKVLLGKRVIPMLSSREAILQAIEKCYDQKERTFDKPKSKESKDFSDVDYDLSQDQSQSEVVNFLNQIIIQSIRKKASDIHFDPNDEGLNVRMRLDGMLVQIFQLPKEFSRQLTTRIKVLAKLDISETRMPQDGRIKIRYSGKDIDFRVSTLPAAYGERVVLRLLDNSQVVLGLKDCGMPFDILESFRLNMQRSQGLILVTGPTGSGKTSTLYSALSELDNNRLNIMTIEDPIEFKIRGLAQIGVNHKIDFTFSKGLRHILRQDPDVIMVGEIRDKETAEIAIQASLTGHLVVSTLHTNDAPSALTRLIDMGIEPFLISSCVSGILAQRLVRKLCSHCKKIEDSAYKKSLFKIEENEKVFQAHGCEECFNLGYKGRTGIYEWLLMGEEVKDQLLRSHDSHNLHRVASNNGMKTLRESSLELVRNGMTSIEEVIKVIP